MRSPWFIAVCLLLACVTLVGISYSFAKRACAVQIARTTDDLDWLRDEFHLSPAEMDRVRELHRGYLPQCQAHCAKIAAKNAELRAALQSGDAMTPEAERALAELATLRAECQADMLRHFYRVSHAMPPEQGRRYLAEMQRLTLGFHEQFESKMDPLPTHGHHQH